MAEDDIVILQEAATGEFVERTIPAAAPVNSSNGLPLEMAVSSPVVALSYAANIATDCALGNVFSVTVTGNPTFDNPTNLKSGCLYTWIVTQDGIGGHNLSWGTKFKFNGGPSGNSAGANDVDVFLFISDGTNLYGTYFLNCF